MTLDPPDGLLGCFHIPREKLSLSEWMEREQLAGHRCACGCGEVIRVKLHHRAKGLPRYASRKHAMFTENEQGQLRAQGLFTVGPAAKELGITVKMLRTLEKRLGIEVRRSERRGLRFYSSEELARIRSALKETTRLGPETDLLTLTEVAAKAGVVVQTLRKHLGVELPAGRTLTKGPGGVHGFAPEEVAAIVAWGRKMRHVWKGRGRGPRQKKAGTG